MFVGVGYQSSLITFAALVFCSLAMLMQRWRPHCMYEEHGMTGSIFPCGLLLRFCVFSRPIFLLLAVLMVVDSIAQYLSLCYSTKTVLRACNSVRCKSPQRPLQRLSLLTTKKQNAQKKKKQGANVLLSKKGAVKLADFGTSKPMDQDSVVSGLKGTPNWMAPEVIKNHLLPGGWLQADVWSVGCTVVEMLTGKMPWPNMSNPLCAMFKIVSGDKPPINR